MWLYFLLFNLLVAFNCGSNYHQAQCTNNFNCGWTTDGRCISNDICEEQEDKCKFMTGLQIFNHVILYGIFIILLGCLCGGILYGCHRCVIKRLRKRTDGVLYDFS